MRSRMDRYKDNSSINNKSYSRTNKNNDLYKNIGSNQKYTNFTDVSNINAVEIDPSNNNYRTRENYQRMKDYGGIVETPKVKRQLDDFNYLYQDHENKIYDINTVLEEARKNRIKDDELEEKRKLKNTNYNILADLNPEEVKKYHERKNKVIKASDDEIRELIDTITSKTLAGELSKSKSVDLLSDLMATNVIDKVEKSDDIDNKLSLSKEILDKESLEKVNSIKDTLKEGIMKNADTDFYTRSMDLSDKDFDIGDDFKEKKMPKVLKALLIIILLAVIGFSIYYVLNTYDLISLFTDKFIK